MTITTRVKFAAKVMVSAGLLTYLLMQADWGTIWKATRNADGTLILVAFLLFYVHFFIGALRWRLLARLHGADPAIAYLVQSFMVANFFNNFLPSTIGGDVVRIYDTWRAGTTMAGATAIIFVDRVIGVLVLAIIAATGTLMLDQHGLISFRLQGLAVVLILALLCIVALLFHPPAWWTRTIQWSALHRLNWIARPAAKFQEVAREFQGARGTLAAAVLLSFFLHSNIIFAYYLVGIAVGIDLHPTIFVAVIPLALVAMMVPLSINGIGLREGAFSALFGLFGISVALALVFSWVFYALTLIHGMIGGIVYLLRKDKPFSKRPIAGSEP